MNTSQERSEKAVSTGIMIAIAMVLVGLLLFVGFVAVGLGTLLVVRTRDVERQAVSDRVRAIAEAERAQRLEERLAEDREAAPDESDGFESFDTEPDARAADTGESPVMPVRRITIDVDQHGEMIANGEATDLDTLKVTLRQQLEETDLELAIVVRVDPRCLFQHVAGILTACEQLGIDNVRIMALTDTEPSEATQ